ncbi:phosphoglucosamine mutase, partial [Planctomycetota bacterium]
MQLFGTDGIRSIAGEGPLVPEAVARVGRAVGETFLELGSGDTGTVVVGRDTRASGVSIAARLAGGLKKAGMTPLDAGVVPTPAVSYLARSGSHALGLMVTASHNPPQYNGIKVFTGCGTKADE